VEEALNHKWFRKYSVGELSENKLTIDLTTSYITNGNSAAHVENNSISGGVPSVSSTCDLKSKHQPFAQSFLLLLSLILLST
jgi:hypothetical protein